MSANAKTGNGKGKKVEFSKCFHHYSTNENGKTVRSIELKPNPRVRYKREKQEKGKADLLVRIPIKELDEE